jgi:TonB family protein
MSLPPKIAALCGCMAIAFGQSSSDALEENRGVLQANPSNSLAHYRIAEILVSQKNYQSAANELREALNGDLQPRWVEVWSHINLGKVFEATGQRDRAMNEYRQAGLTNDNTGGALDEAANRLMQAGQNGGPPGTYRVTNIATVEPISRTEPEYSEEARLAGLEGTVFLSAVIAEDGSPRDLKVVRPLGLGLDEKAVEAAIHWRFSPSGSAAAPRTVNIAVDFLLPDKLSRWHLMGESFHPPDGATRPVFLAETYPLGAGIGPRAIDQGWVINAIRRQATVTLSFDVEEHGYPVGFQVVKASDPIWEDEAIAVVHGWRFTPGTKDGIPVSVPCTLDLVWGQKTLTSATLAKMREGGDPPLPQVASQPPPDQKDQVETSTPAKSPRLELIEISLRADSPTPTPADGSQNPERLMRMLVSVGENGAPQDIQVVESLGKDLDDQAVAAVSKWNMRTVLVNDQLVASHAVFEVKFRPARQTPRRRSLP